MQPDLFPDAPQRPAAPGSSTVEAQILGYAAERERGITLYGVMRDLDIRRSIAIQKIGEMVKSGALQPSGKHRRGCRVYLAPQT